MISVIIPSYNRARTIEKSARSVLNQTYTDLELIIVDDCSSDNTAEVVAALAAEDPRVRYIRHEQNQGACAARNTGIDAARGEYIAFQDSDDAWFPDKLQIQLDRLTQTDADVVFCKYVRTIEGEDGQKIGPREFAEGFQDSLTTVWGIGTQTLLMKREVLDNIRFDEALPRFQDVELLLRIVEHYRLYCVDVPLVDYRVGADSIGKHPEYAYRAADILLRKYPDLVEKYPSLGKSIAGQLLKDVSYAGKGKDVQRRDVYRLIYRLDSSFKCRVKLLMRITGCYDPVMTWREERKRNHSSTLIPNGGVICDRLNAELRHRYWNNGKGEAFILNRKRRCGGITIKYGILGAGYSVVYGGLCA